MFWDTLTPVRLGMNRMAREIGAAFISDNYDKERYRPDDPRDRPTFFTLDDGGLHDRLAFTAFVNRRLYRDEKVSDQAIVEYFLDNDEDGIQNLYRRQKNLIDEHWDEGGETYVLMPNVDLSTEMVNAMAAARAYEANVSVMEITKSMIASSLRLIA